MSEPIEIGRSPWTRSEILESLDEFAALYPERPIKDNQGGMKAPHMFATWFMAKKLAPDLIVESGIWKGQSTWLFEKACPQTRIVSLDLKLEYRTYISDRAEYSNRDFSEQDWRDVTDRSLVFFDDHQNAYKRLQQSHWFGFKHVIFEDNYPPSRGDCYSLKQAFAHAGFDPSNSSRLMKKVVNIFGINPVAGTPQYQAASVRPNAVDAAMLRRHVDTYYEFPPTFKLDKTRWGDDWDPSKYPTPVALLDQTPTTPSQTILYDEAKFYTWICYTKLK